MILQDEPYSWKPQLYSNTDFIKDYNIFHYLYVKDNTTIFKNNSEEYV